MKVKKICVIITYIVLLLLIVEQRAYSQPQFNKTFEVGLTNLLWFDITFVYTQRIKEKSFLEISNSFVIRKSKEHDNADYFFLNTQDPAKLYDLYKLRVGLRYFHSDRFYSCPSVIFNIGGFKDRTIMHYYDDKGSDYYDKDYRLSRLRFDVGVIYKFGFLKTGKNLGLKNVYFGVGFKAKFYHDTIFQKWQWHRLYFDGPPMHENYVKFTPTFHFGIMLVDTR